MFSSRLNISEKCLRARSTVLVWASYHYRSGWQSRLAHSSLAHSFACDACNLTCVSRHWLLYKQNNSVDQPLLPSAVSRWGGGGGQPSVSPCVFGHGLPICYRAVAQVNSKYSTLAIYTPPATCSDLCFRWDCVMCVDSQALIGLTSSSRN